VCQVVAHAPAEGRHRLEPHPAVDVGIDLAPVAATAASALATPPAAVALTAETRLDDRLDAIASAGGVRLLGLRAGQRLQAGRISGDLRPP